MPGPGVGELVQAAAAGDQAAWDAIVDRFAALVWSVARGHRLSQTDAADVSQTVWLKLVENLGAIREPERLAGWISTTARNECLRLLRRSGRVVLSVDNEDRDRVDEHAPPLDARLLDAERDTALWRAFALISTRCQGLLRLLLTDPPPSYDEVGAALDMPIGSIGPTRGRCLQHLKAQLATIDL